MTASYWTPFRLVTICQVMWRMANLFLWLPYFCCFSHPCRTRLFREGAGRGVLFEIESTVRIYGVSLL